MNDNIPLYNSRIIKTFLEYLEKYYPDLDINTILKYADMTKYNVGDQGHWFSQYQVDRFNEILVTEIGNPNLAKEAGRYLTSSNELGAVKQYMLGFINPMSLYMLMEKLYPMLSRGAVVNTKKLRSNSVEITSVPKQGVQEKFYQCENRLGGFESLAKLFTNKLASITHPDCFHKGKKKCRYIITWERTSSLIWKRIRNYFVLFNLLIPFALLLFLPILDWGMFTLSFCIITMAIVSYSEYQTNKELTKTIEDQGNAAERLLDEINIRHENAMLVQEIGQATSAILDVDKLLITVMGVIKKRLDFDRGLMMLSNTDKSRLNYSDSFGYTQNQVEQLQRTAFHLDNPGSKGIFIISYKQQRPFLINDMSDIENNLSKRSYELAKKMGVQSLICVPIVYEKESLGILAVDNIESKSPLTQSDMSLLMGVASQTAVSITNARSFQKLQESEKKYRDLVENANSIILRRDTSGNITFFNEYAQKLFGYTEEEILGENIVGTILPELEHTVRELDKLTNSLNVYPDHTFISEDQNMLRNGEQVWVAWTYKPIFNDNGILKEILCIGNDITELKQAEQARKELEVRLQRAQKMEALGTLAGGVAHDLNNILSGIVSYPELLLMGMPEDSPLRKPIKTMQKSGEKAAAIVQDLLTLARRGVLTTKTTNINTIITEYLTSPEFENLKAEHPNMQIKKRLGKELLNILGSPVHLSKTIMNLISNSAEAMPNGGIVNITTKNRYIDRPIRGYDEVEKGDYVTVTITDNGIGIPNNDLDRIFEPFYTKKVMGRSGTGLGMAVVWGTVKDHKGYIDVKSIEGKGTTFTLYFPLTRRETEDEEIEWSIEDYQGNGESILVVDDAPEQREIASGLLIKLGYSANSVSSGEKAIEYLKENSVDLLVLDMIMDPGIDGYETYKRIIKFKPRQKAIIVSGFSETKRVKAAQKLGVGAYVKKPYLLTNIGRAVRVELEK